MASDQRGRDAVDRRVAVVVRAVEALRGVVAAIDAGDLACPSALRNYLSGVIVALDALGSDQVLGGGGASPG